MGTLTVLLTMARFNRRRFLWGLTGVSLLTGCVEQTGADDPEEREFLSTRVETDEEFEVNLDFLKGDEVTFNIGVGRDGITTIQLLHGGRSVLDKKIDGPTRDTIDIDIEQRNGTFHKLVVLTEGTPATVEVTVRR